MTALRSTARAMVRALDDRDLAELRGLIQLDPFANAVLAARIEAAGTLRADRLGGDVVGIGPPGALRAAGYLGGNVLVVGGQHDEWHALAEFAAGRPRGCSSIIAGADVLAVFWPALRRSWGAARILRPCQPLLVTDTPARGVADPDVRPARVSELDRYLPAAAAMFAEELDMAPFDGPTRPTYRLRLAELIASGRAFVRVDDAGAVVFKAEIGAISRATCQVQGVWVRPDLRGRGVGTSAMAAVIGHALRLAPTVSLYVNDFNVAARRLYARLGMRQVGTLATVLF